MTTRHSRRSFPIGCFTSPTTARQRLAQLAWCGAALAVLTILPPAGAAAFDDYHLTGSFQLPGGTVFDVLGDGRLITLNGPNVYAETAVGTHTFALLGTLPNADLPGGAYGGAAFVRVSPDGTRIAVGNNGGASYSHFQVGVFGLANLAGTWLAASHYDAEWFDNGHLALTAGTYGAPSAVTLLDPASNPAAPTNPVIVAGIGGSPAGIAFDALGNLYTGNGYAGSGPSGTGWIKAFSASAWQAPLAGGVPTNFETGGVLIGDVLSAAALGFDGEGNLHVGGGDFIDATTYGYAALVRASAVASALAGGGPVDPADPARMRRFDPDSANPYNFYDVNFNVVTGELYVREGATVYTYLTPEPATLAALALGVLVLRRRRARVARASEWSAEQAGGPGATCTGGTAACQAGSAPRSIRMLAARAPRSRRFPAAVAFPVHQRPVRSPAATTPATVAFPARQRPVQSPAATRGAPAATTAAAVLFVLATTAWPAAAQSPFATRVIAFNPAPGQFVNDATYDDPSRALGAPVGGGTQAPGNTSLVSLGGFGGSITLGFDHTVLDDPANPFGLDCIIYGNATWVLNAPWRKWAECGSVEISRDINGNGVADDPWYLIPGSHITNPAGQWQTQTWDDNIDDPTYPPDDDLWIPPGHTGTWTTAAYRLPPAMFETSVLENPGGSTATTEVVWGYADTSPTLRLGDLNGDNVVDDPNSAPAVFYTRPDNPFKVGVTPGCGGGDAFDIAWAIDPATGAPANLDGFDFIRITTTANVVLPLLLEKSTEVDAVADVDEGVLGNAENDGDFDLDDFAIMRDCWLGPDVVTPTSPCRVMDYEQDRDIDLADFAQFQADFTGPGVTP